MEQFVYKIEKSAVVALETGSNALTVQPTMPILVVRFGVMVTEATTGASPTVVTFNHEQVAGAALTPSGAAIDTCTVPTGTAIGKGIYTQLASPMLILPGEQAEFVGNNGADDGSGIIFCQYYELPFQASTIDRGDYNDITAPAAETTWTSMYTESA